MRSIQLALALFLCNFASPLIAEDRSPPAPDVTPSTIAPKYELVWSDEFDGNGPPDAANWNLDRGFLRNQELQLYQADNARCENGNLIIEARRERVENPRYRPNSRDWRRNREHAEYTSASLNTRGKHEFLYGRFEMRGRIDVRPGMWPAFWTLGKGAWPAGGEIDIMEFYSNTLLANAAWLGKAGRSEWDDFKRNISHFRDPDWSKKFHTWRMDWDHDSIRLFLDDELLNEVSLEKTINDDGSNRSPFREPQYLLLNLAIGGTQGGDPSKTSFPARFEVDYVRVFQKR